MRRFEGRLQPSQDVRKELFQEFCSREPKLLRPLRIPSHATGSARRCRGLYLTFHMGQLEIVPSADRSDELAVRIRLEPQPVPGDAIVASEEEPWWTLMGSPLIAAWAVSPDDQMLEEQRLAEREDVESTGSVPGVDTSANVGIDLQFRRAEANPKIVSLRIRDGEIEISVRRPSLP